MELSLLKCLDLGGLIGIEFFCTIREMIIGFKPGQAVEQLLAELNIRLGYKKKKEAKIDSSGSKERYFNIPAD